MIHVLSHLHGSTMLYAWCCDCSDTGPWCNSYAIAEAYGNQHVATSALHSTERSLTAEERKLREPLRIVTTGRK